jgi:precorrin-6A/cobalt-precorrin-6A reductase
MRILILGGTTEASHLARRLAGRTDIDPVLSYAGRTQEPKPQPIPTRVGGFGGIDGLAAYLIAESIDLMIDATHPFAVQISENAAAAAKRTRTPLFVFSRAPWAPEPGDRWIEVVDNHAAMAALGRGPKRVLLTIGRLGVDDFRAAPQHHYIIRTIDAPDAGHMPPDHRLVLARGPFSLEDELALMRDEAVDILVTKNSGGRSTYAKIEAARTLGLPVIMVTPPARPDVPVIHDLEACLAAIEAHRPSLTR